MSWDSFQNTEWRKKIGLNYCFQGYDYRSRHLLVLRFVTIVEEEKGGGQEEHPPQNDDKGAKHEGIAQTQELP